MRIFLPTLDIPCIVTTLSFICQLEARNVTDMFKTKDSLRGESQKRIRIKIAMNSQPPTMQNIENLTLKDLLNADFSAMDEDMVTSIAFKIGSITSNLTDSIRHRNKSDTERLAVFSKTITKSG